MNRNTLLVAGATGIVGTAAIEHFASSPSWDVVALSRRPLPAASEIRHLPVDLTDADACKRASASLERVTHVLYAALYEKPNLVAGWLDREQIDVNLAMLRNLIDAVKPVASSLRHITVLQGTKAYGSHVGPVPVPAKERWPRLPHEIFYWQQEDLLRERQAKSGWSFTILRPQIILGYAVASPMNIVAAIGVYASIMRELGRPLSFPGGGRYVNAASDSRLIARAIEFAGTNPVAANETYNVVNGDVLVWHDVLPSIATHFGMPVGDPRPTRLADEMPGYERVWARIVERHGLQPLSLAQLINSSWQFADRNFGYGLAHPSDRVVSPIKLRQAGFDGCEDTEDALIYWLSRMQRAKLLPP
jgi:nucleoside-diphosphate-sugar epimerase